MLRFREIFLPYIACIGNHRQSITLKTTIGFAFVRCQAENFTNYFDRRVLYLSPFSLKNQASVWAPISGDCENDNILVLTWRDNVLKITTIRARKPRSRQEQHRISPLKALSAPVRTDKATLPYRLNTSPLPGAAAPEQPAFADRGLPTLMAPIPLNIIRQVVHNFTGFHMLKLVSHFNRHA